MYMSDVKMLVTTKEFYLKQLRMMKELTLGDILIIVSFHQISTTTTIIPKVIHTTKTINHHQLSMLNVHDAKKEKNLKVTMCVLLFM